MARTYDIPPDTSEKEKAIGGVLTFTQFGWLMVGLVLALIVFLIIYLPTQSKAVGICFAAPFALVGVPFAFYRKYEMSLLTYLRVNNRFKKKIKKLINI